MSEGYSVDIERKVYGEDGASICIRPSSDFPEMYTEITTYHSLDSIEYYGSFSLLVPNAVAKLIGQALLDRVDDVESNKSLTMDKITKFPEKMKDDIYLDLLERAYKAMKFYIDASKDELLVSNMTRNDALIAFREIEIEIYEWKNRNSNSD